MKPANAIFGTCKLSRVILDEPAETFLRYYDELTEDADLIAGLNDRMAHVRDKHGFVKGIFQRESVESADWFAFERVLLYVLMRHLQPARCLETGVFYGGNTAFILAGLVRNGTGKLVSIDLPDSKIRETPSVVRHPLVGDSECYSETLSPGFIVPDYLRSQWDFIEGDSHQVIPTLSESFDFYIHDSDHSYEFVRTELELVTEKLSGGAVIVADDIDWSNGFFAFCAKRQLHPLLLTDNGKDNLRVRIGLAKLDHPSNRIAEIIGCAS